MKVTTLRGSAPIATCLAVGRACTVIGALANSLSTGSGSSSSTPSN